MSILIKRLYHCYNKEVFLLGQTNAGVGEAVLGRVTIGEAR